ncbi:DUF3152 domain-containing protein [Phytohabitans rumicis]|uniref:DUF3152 domain-containing protein n=1 Tax=Phytohabitans rumicis TaxID=1076125 RepID=UPI0031E65A09
MEARRIAHDRMRHRRRRSAVLLLLVAATGLIGIDLARDRTPAPVFTQPTPTPAATTVAPLVPVVLRPSPSLSPTPSAAPSFPVTGPGTFAYAAGSGPLLGTGGMLRRFRIAVEETVGQDPDAFAGAVDRILGDPRSWIAAKQFRLQRVPKGMGAEFTVYLATPATSERMCAAGGLDTEQYTSCRLPGQVIINLARWLTAVPDYRAPIADYQAYAINHEVGHQFGHGHEACPSPGAPAPVMQQQTLGLRGCLANGWPYLDGRRYSGAPVP